jgi:fumarate reductase subunit D
MADPKTPAPKGNAAVLVTVLTLFVSMMVALKVIPATDEGTLDALIQSTATQVVAIASSIAIAVKYVHDAIAAHKTPAAEPVKTEQPN